MGMPFRSVARMSGGIVDMDMLEGILKMVNGRFIAGLWHYVRACFRKGRRSE
jgi:beta-glucosidase